MNEATEQAKIVRRLRYAGILFCHVPNGLEITERAKRNLARQGLRPGVPDLLIFTPPPAKPGAAGTALEMKTTKRGSALRENQKEWLANLEAVGWESIVGWGAEDAIAKLRALGYEV